MLKRLLATGIVLGCGAAISACGSDSAEKAPAKEAGGDAREVLELDIRPKDVIAGSVVGIQGRSRTPLEEQRRVELFEDEFPFDEFEPSEAKPDPQWGTTSDLFAFAARPRMNTRYQARAGEVRSPVVTVYAGPRPYRVVTREGPDGHYVMYSARVPEGLRIRRASVVFYTRPGGADVLRRFGRAPLEQKGGVVVAGLPLDPRRDGDFFYACAPDGVVVGMGRSKSADGGCGSATLKATKKRLNPGR
jgi:hypothetical protein